MKRMLEGIMLITSFLLVGCGNDLSSEQQVLFDSAYDKLNDLRIVTSESIRGIADSIGIDTHYLDQDGNEITWAQTLNHPVVEWNLNTDNDRFWVTMIHDTSRFVEQVRPPRSTTNQGELTPETDELPISEVEPTESEETCNINLETFSKLNENMVLDEMIEVIGEEPHGYEDNELGRIYYWRAVDGIGRISAWITEDHGTTLSALGL